MDTKILFQLALGDISPWEVRSVEFKVGEDGKKELHLELDFPPGSTFRNKRGESCKAHDTSNHTWRHLNFFEHRCYLHARVPRVKSADGQVETVTAPWASSNNGFTLLFEAFVLALIESEMPVSNVAALVGEYDQRIWGVFHRHVSRARAQTDYSGITEIGIDETSSRKGHNYITLAVDLTQCRVIEVVKGKDEQTVAEIADFLDKNGSPSKAVEHVSIDMSPAFIAGCGKHLPNAAITFDHFHVTKAVSKAMDDLRKAEQQECKELKGQKYNFLRNPETLSERKKAALQQAITLYPKIGEGYRFKELLREFWKFNDAKKAEEFLLDWCKQVDKSGIQPFIKAANTIRAHWSGIVNYARTKITNGILEGINSKIQLAKKRARGYRNIDNFISMALFVSGKMNFNYLPM